MTKLYLVLLVIIWRSIVPSIATVALPQLAAAQPYKPTANNLQGKFTSEGWRICIYYRNNTYNYAARDPQGGSIELAGATIRRDGVRKIYTWNNGGTRYQVIWQPQDPDSIRVRVTTPQGRQVFDRLFPRAQQDQSC
jgi:hypothetical protein